MSQLGSLFVKIFWGRTPIPPIIGRKGGNSQTIATSWDADGPTGNLVPPCQKKNLPAWKSAYGPVLLYKYFLYLPSCNSDSKGNFLLCLVLIHNVAFYRNRKPISIAHPGACVELRGNDSFASYSLYMRISVFIIHLFGN